MKMLIVKHGGIACPVYTVRVGDEILKTFEKESSAVRYAKKSGHGMRRAKGEDDMPGRLATKGLTCPDMPGRF